MLSVKTLEVILVAHSIMYINIALGADEPWSYDNTTAWGAAYPKCNGNRQSPIELWTNMSTAKYISPLKFRYYELELTGPITLLNNGHTVNMNIPTTSSGYRPYFLNGIIQNKFEAMSLHFHWSSDGYKGSEHKINGHRFDVEMHIVHKNVKYVEESEALRNEDGFAVLGVMFKGVQILGSFHPGLRKIFDRLPDLVENNSTIIEGSLTLGQMLGDLNTWYFFTYDGSLTTPPCAETVKWYVFPQPLYVPYQHIEQFWNLVDFNSNPLNNNFRPIQKWNNRPIYYTVGRHIIKSVLWARRSRTFQHSEAKKNQAASLFDYHHRPHSKRHSINQNIYTI